MRPRSRPQCLMHYATYIYISLSYHIIYHKTDISQTEFHSKLLQFIDRHFISHFSK